MSKYESIMILNPKVEDKDIEKITDEIAKLVKVTHTDILGLKKLAYEVKGNTEGYYIDTYFNGTSEDVTTLEKYYREEDLVIKFITICTGGEND